MQCSWAVVWAVGDRSVWQVGIEDCLHIEFEYNRSKYHLKDVVIGKIYFLLVLGPSKKRPFLRKQASVPAGISPL